MNIYLVAPQQVAALWPKVEEFIRKAVARAEFPVEGEWDIKKACIDGRWELWIACDEEMAPHAAVVLRFSDYPKLRVCEVPYIGGRRMKEWLGPMGDAIEARARDRGAAAMMGFGREGWCRVAGYRPVFSTFIKELGDVVPR